MTATWSPSQASLWLPRPRRSSPVGPDRSRYGVAAVGAVLTVASVAAGAAVVSTIVVVLAWSTQPRLRAHRARRAGVATGLENRSDLYTRREYLSACLFCAASNRRSRACSRGSSDAPSGRTSDDELARKLVKEMDDHRNVSVSRMRPERVHDLPCSWRPEAVRGLRRISAGRVPRIPRRARAGAVALLGAPVVLVTTGGRPRRGRVRSRLASSGRRENGPRGPPPPRWSSRSTAGTDDDLPRGRAHHRRPQPEPELARARGRDLLRGAGSTQSRRSESYSAVRVTGGVRVRRQHLRASMQSSGEKEPPTGSSTSARRTARPS